jgi:hypothetical protein
VEEAVTGTSTVAPLEGIESAIDIDIDIDNLINDVDLIGATFDPRMPNTEVPTSITCNPHRSPRDKSIRDMVNKEDAFDEGYDSDGEMGSFFYTIGGFLLVPGFSERVVEVRVSPKFFEIL